MDRGGGGGGNHGTRKFQGLPSFTAHPFCEIFLERERETDREGAKSLTDGIKMMSTVCVMKNIGKFDVTNVKFK